MFKPLLTGAVLVVAAFGLPTAGAQTKPTATASMQATDQFSAIHDVLDRTANDVLADAVQRMTNAADDRQGSVPPRSPEALIRDFDQKYRSGLTPSVGAAMKRLDQFRPTLSRILESEGVPPEIVSVVVVESGGRTTARSPKGALGLWQLMPDTARRYGLVVTPSRDDRLDVERSTRAAAHYLRDLYQQFGSGPLALAAYNAGEQRVQRAVERASTFDFIQLSKLQLLPQETRNYVPAVLSAMQLLELLIYRFNHRVLQGGAILAESSLPSRVYNPDFASKAVERDPAKTAMVSLRVAVGMIATGWRMSNPKAQTRAIGRVDIPEMAVLYSD